MCGYCSGGATSAHIEADILNGSPPDDALTCPEGWRAICRHKSGVDNDTWTEICRQRGYNLGGWHGYKGWTG